MAVEPTGTTNWNYGNWGSTNGWYNPNSLYGANQSYISAPIISGAGGYLEQPSNYDASWTRYAAEMGWDSSTALGKYARNQFPQIEEGYRASLATNPFLRFNEYIRGLDVPGRFMMQTAQQRGENPGLYSPRARTISRGY